MKRPFGSFSSCIREPGSSPERAGSETRLAEPRVPEGGQCRTTNDLQIDDLVLDPRGDVTADVRVKVAHRAGTERDLVGVLGVTTGVHLGCHRSDLAIDPDRRNRAPADRHDADGERARVGDVLESGDRIFELAGDRPEVGTDGGVPVPSVETRGGGPVPDVRPEGEGRGDGGHDEGQADEHAPHRVSRSGRDPIGTRGGSRARRGRRSPPGFRGRRHATSACWSRSLRVPGAPSY